MTPNWTDFETRLTLAIDAGSPVVSTALARGGKVVAERQGPSGRSSQGLVQMIDALLSEVDADIGEVGGIVALRGPGSFTGLRVGLSTCLGLHQALGAPATTLTTFETLAAVAPERDLIVVAAVESIRQSWLIQRFRADDIPEPLSEARSVTIDQLAAEDADLLIGFGLSDLSIVDEGKLRAPVLDAPPLAGPALQLLRRKGDLEWDPSGLVRPLYLQAVSATPPAAPTR